MMTALHQKLPNINTFTLCPLIENRKLITEKTNSSLIDVLAVINYKNKQFIVIGEYYGKIQIYDSENLDLVAEETKEIRRFESTNYIGQLPCGDFIVVTDRYIRIFVFYLDEYNECTNSINNKYDIQLVQKIEYYDKESMSKFKHFSKAYNFDRNLYREFDKLEIEKNRKLQMKDINYLGSFPIDDELIISSNNGIFLYSKEKNNNSNYTNYINNMNENKFNILEYLDKKKTERYLFVRKITDLENYDSIQINFKYIAGTIENYLALYSIETCELVTKFNIKISEHCDSVIFMLDNDILCAAGEDTITLISIKKFDIILVTKIQDKYKITEICILPDYNILIGMQYDKSGIIRDNYMEYFYQYKCFHKLNCETKKMEYDIIQVSSKLLTKKFSNITMRCLNNNRLVTITNCQNIQIWE